MTNLKLVYITKVLLIKLNKIESDFKVVHHLSTNHAFSEIRADPLNLSIDYTQNDVKRFKGITFILYSGTCLAYFGTSFVYCLYYVFGYLKYALSNTTLSILFFISVICQSQNSDSFPYFHVPLLYSSAFGKIKNETELSTQIVCLILSHFVISIHVHSRSVPIYLTSGGFWKQSEKFCSLKI